MAEIPLVTTWRKNWMEVGSSVSSDNHAAGVEAASAAFRPDEDARLVIVFCSDHYDGEALLAGIRSITGSIPLMGCSTGGEIHTTGAESRSVVVTVLGGTELDVIVRSAVVIDGEVRKTAAEAAASQHELMPYPHQTVLVLADGLAGDMEEVVRGIYREVGAAVPFVGGCTGGDLGIDNTVQFFNEHVLTNAVVIAAISSSSPLGIGVSHGLVPIGEPMVVTESNTNEVISLDGRPALDVYLERLGVSSEITDDPAAFAALSLDQPLGVARRHGTELRVVLSADAERRTLNMIANVPQGGIVQLMTGDRESALSATTKAANDALAAIDGSPAGLLVFDCVARRGTFGEEINREIEALRNTAQNTPVAGFYTYGEIARTSGTKGFHNQTIVVLAVA